MFTCGGGQRLPDVFRERRALPDAPTLLELMKNELLVQENWTGLSAPAKTPSDVVNRLHAETVKALADPKVAEAIAKYGIDINKINPLYA